MNKTQKSIALAIGGAFAFSVAATTVNAAGNPFAIKSLSSGYQVADHHEEKMKDGKCGTGKCGAEKTTEGKCSADKAAEGKCSADKAKEGSCSADKMKEGKCSADKK
jgi:uncharacterized low-complexity protein